MKFKKISIALTAFGLLLSACAGGPKVFDLTFHQTYEGPNEDFTVEVTQGVTTQEEIWSIEPEINERPGYSAEWEEYDILSMNSDLVVEPVYLANTYTATFKNRVTNSVLGTTTFTVEDTELSSFPELPTELGYTYAWESYQIQPNDMTVWCDREANIHTLKFFEDSAKTNQVGETINFTCETDPSSIDEPEVPFHEGFEGRWPEYDLTLDLDLEVVAIYELHQYYLDFRFEGRSYGLVGYDLTMEYSDITKPEVPTKTGYEVSWPSDVTLAYAEKEAPQVVEGIATPATYTVSYKGIVDTTKVTFGAAYELLAPGGGYAWYYGDTKVPTTGESWNYPHNVELEARAAYVILDFEDGVNPYVSINQGFDSISVVDNEGIDGSKALKLSYTDTSAFDARATFDKGYLDFIFDDPQVKALEFSAKGTVATNNFRHITVDASVVGGNTTIVSTYEANSQGYGIDTVYKKFYLTRGVYEQMSDTSWAIQYGATGPFDLYLDNIKASTVDYSDYSVGTFENGKFDLSNKRLLNPTGNNNRLIQWNEIPSNVTFSYEYKTEGNRSLQFQKNNGENSFYISQEMLNAIGEEGILFDVRSTAAINADAVQAGNSNTSIPKAQGFTRFAANVWHTLQVKKSQMTSDGRFIKFCWSTSATMYIDNIRMAKSSVESFESAKGTKQGEYGYIANYPILNDQDGSNCRDLTKTFILLSEWAACTNAEVTTERASHGISSAKFTLSKSGPLAIAPYLVKLMDDDSTIKLDVYTEDMDIISPIFGEYPKGEWFTITITKADLNGNRFIHQNEETSFASAGTIYFDNLVFTL
jgi:hypothetical protein